SRSAVDSASVNTGAFDGLLKSSKSKSHGIFLFSAEPGSDRRTAYSRMFAPGLGVAEDPATGIASGPLGCYLVKHKIVPPEKAGAMLSLQGVKMGRRSHVHISIGMQNGDVNNA